MRFLSSATDTEQAERLGRLLAGVETEADIAAITPAPPVTAADLARGRQVRDPRTLPGWRPGYKPVGSGGAHVTVGGPRGG